MTNTLAEKIALIRSPGRLGAPEVIRNLFTDFFEVHGDRQLGDDPAVIAGVARFHAHPVTILGVQRGKTPQQRQQVNGGAVRVTGYRKALRVVQAAEKFQRPVISLLNMPGADASVFSEQHGQSEAIADLILKMGQLKVPNMTLFLGEGHSGGALAFSNVNRIMMLENALFSVASPEAVQAILKNQTQTQDASAYLLMTAIQLHKIGVADQIISETPTKSIFKRIDAALQSNLQQLDHLSGLELVKQRREKFMHVVNEQRLN
ncbi:carboxyltransferase subunit alpha [Pediococcus siamensis]|uniref:carboxyltransferase subunit alpha n=1 Tax=Pediococcus siamensis TaxID=381829 RepID=UPI00399FB9A4